MLTQTNITNFFLTRYHRVAFKPFFKEVYFIPEHASLQKAKKIIEAQHCAITSLKEFKAQLQSAIKSSASSENEDVQAFSLARMCELLASNSHYLQETLIQNDNVDVVIRDLIRLLIGIPKERGEKIYSLVGKFRCIDIYVFAKYI